MASLRTSAEIAALDAAAEAAFKGIAADAFGRLLDDACQWRTHSRRALVRFIADWFDEEKYPCGVVWARLLSPAETADLLLVLEFRERCSTNLRDLAPESIARVQALIAAHPELEAIA